MTIAVAPAFDAPVFDAAYAYRAVLSAMSRPGTLHDLPTPPAPPSPLSPVLAAVILTLCDIETPLWLAPLYGETVRAWCDFHTGAPQVAEPADATFVVAPASAAPALHTLSTGSDERPDRSATLVIDCKSIASETVGGQGVTLTGPGIDGRRAFAADALSPAFQRAWRDNNARFPRGIDVIFGAGHAVAALARTTRIEAG